MGVHFVKDRESLSGKRSFRVTVESVVDFGNCIVSDVRHLSMRILFWFYVILNVLLNKHIFHD